PGDEIRHIDWKVVGKTDKYHIKQFEQSTNLKCHILLDASGSMGYKSQASGDKMDYARTLVSALSYLLLKQFDAVGLIAFNDQVISRIPPRSKPSHLQHILQCVAALEPQGITLIGKVITDTAPTLPGRGMLIIVSDLFTDEESIIKSLKLLHARGMELILFHILHPDEMTLPFEGDILFESLEDDPSITLDPVEIRETYQNLVRERIEFFRKHCAAIGIDYMFLETNNPLEQALTYYLLKRKSLYKK
ncbi:MAG: hypothetical protein A3K09_04170, partial [Nitrospinae bacterium RIFCSPLOWO2_12_FULL_47_7]